MRRIDIEKRIFNTYNDKIDNMKININLSDYELNQNNQSYKNSIFTRRFVFRTAFLVFLLFISFFALRGVVNNTQPVLARSQDIVAFQAVSSTDLLVQTALNQSTTLGFYNSLPGLTKLATSQTSNIESELNILNQYMNMIEQFIASKSELNVQIVASDNPDYQLKLIYQGFDLSGKAIKYNFYYSETALSADSTRNFVFNDEYSDKAQLLLQGTMTVLNKTYLLEGKQITYNNEEIYSLYSYIDNSNYVYVRYETDLIDGKKKFFYTVVSDGVVQNQSKIGISTKNNKLLTNLEFQNGDTVGSYKIVRGDNGNALTVDISYVVEKMNVGTETGTITVQIVTDSTTQNTNYVYVIKPANSGGEKTYEGERRDSFGEHDEDEYDNSGHEQDSSSQSTQDGTTTTQQNADSNDDESTEIDD